VIPKREVSRSRGLAEFWPLLKQIGNDMSLTRARVTLIQRRRETILGRL
jgi:hypothetical protein